MHFPTDWFGPCKWCVAAAGLGLVLAGAGQAAAQERDGATWTYGAELYVWGSSIGIETLSGEDVDVSFREILESLDFAGMGTLAARRGPWLLFGDAIYLDTQSNQTVLAPNMSGGVTGLSTGVGLRSFISTFGAGYRVFADARTDLTALAGARYLWSDTTLNLSLGFGLGGTDFSGDRDAWDGVIGLRGRSALTEDWSVTYYGDIGTGDSAFTGQVQLAANYAYRAVEFSFGYRYLYWDLNDFGPFDTLDISGPYAGVRFTF